MMRFFTTAISLFAVFLLLGLASCQRETETVPDYRPELPPIEAFIFEKALFMETEEMVAEDSQKQNWNFADSIAAYWMQGKLKELILSESAFVSIHDLNEPIFYNEQKAFIWDAELVYKGVPYVAELRVNPEGEHLLWEMWIRAEGGEQEVLLFDGQTTLDTFLAKWNIYASTGQKEPTLTVIYKKDTTTGVSILTYSSTADNNYITYLKNEADTVNASYRIYYDQQVHLYDIHFNTFTFEGQIIQNEQDTLCWDSIRKDVDCE